MKTTNLKQIACILALALMACAARAQTGWTNTYSPIDVTRQGTLPSAIAVDPSGNVFIGGTGADTSFNAVYVSIKYSNSGMPLWTNLYTTAGGASASAIAVDTNGNVFVTGYSYDVSYNQYYATIKYSNAGVPLWTNFYTMAGGASASAIAVDTSGNAFVTGSASDGINSFAATIKYSNVGLPLWTNLFAGGASAFAIVVDGNANVFVTGQSNDGTNEYYETIKYSNAGVPLWTNLYTWVGGYYGSSAIAVDGNGNVFVTESPGTIIKYSNAGMPLWTDFYAGTPVIAVDINGNVFVGSPFTVKYSNAGVPIWTNFYTLAANSFAIAVDSSGNAFVTGPSFDGTNYYYFTIKYPAAVVPPVVYLQGQWVYQQLVLSWTNAGFNLQSAPAVTGTFTNIPGATSPYTNPVTGPQQFFRLMQ